MVMLLPPFPTDADTDLTAFYWSGDLLRSRSVGRSVMTGYVSLPLLPARLTADWERDIVQQLALEPGDVESLSLARARTRWPNYPDYLQALKQWALAHGLADVLATSEVALMACRGARYHHDSAQYGHAAFCNLFVSDDKGLDLHFPATGQRLPLTPGLVVVFDTAQPHAVIERGGNGFDSGVYPAGRDCTQVFLTWELPIENITVARALQVDFDVCPVNAAQLQDAQLWRNGAAVAVHPNSGQWCRNE